MFRFLHLLAGICAAALPSLAQEAPSEDLLKAGARLNRLGFSLFSAVRQVRPGNIAVSPWPTHRSLSLAALGARGETRAQIAQLLGTETPLADEAVIRGKVLELLDFWNRAVKNSTQMARLNGAAEWNDLSALWVSHTSAGRADYVAQLLKVPGAKVSAIDFRNPGKALVEVNEWIATATGQRIPRLLPPAAFTPTTPCILTSAFFLKLPWTFQFKPEATLLEPFQIRGEKAERVPTMIGDLELQSALLDDFTVLGLPVAGMIRRSDFQLLIFLPKAGKTLSEVEPKITVELLNQCAKLPVSSLKLHLPRFRVAAATLSLKVPLQALGVRLAFAPDDADFGAMVNGPMWIENVFDACEFSIDENGVSGAGAVTIEAAVFGDLKPVPAGTVMRVDQPFCFALQHVPSRACLFLGRVVDPR